MNLFIQTNSFSVDSRARAGPGGPTKYVGRAGPSRGWRRLGRAGHNISWAALGQAQPPKMAQFRGLTSIARRGQLA